MKFKQWQPTLLASLALCAWQPAISLAAETGVTDTEIPIGLFGPMSGLLAAFGFDPVQATKTGFATREKFPMVMLNAAGDVALIPPTRVVLGAFGGTQRAQNARVALAASDHGCIRENGGIRLDGATGDLAGNPELRAAYLGGKVPTLHPAS